MKKIVVAQYWTSNISYGKFTEPINKNYCEEKNYIYHLETNDDKIKLGVRGRAITWYKPLLILEAFELYNPDYVLFLDADAIICDKEYKIEDFIDEDYDIICTEDYGPSRLNAGVFIMKNTDWTKQFLRIWFESCNIITGGENNTIGYYANALWHDQTCFGILFDNNLEYKKHIKIISNEVLNGREYRNSLTKNFIFHAFSYGHVKDRTIDLAYYDTFNIRAVPSGNDLTEMAKLYDTDKQYEHDYFKLIYNDLFVPIKNNVKKFIEVGILNGQSLLLWRDFFINAEILGLDLDVSQAQKRLENLNKERLTFINVDQSNEEQLKNFSKDYDNIDVIMDDGSHRMYDQQITFATLFKSLKPGGIYVIEDLHTSLEAILPEKNWCGWGDPNKTITLNMLDNFKKTGKIESDYLTDEDKEYLNANIKSVNIYQSRPDWSITSVIIKK